MDGLYSYAYVGDDPVDGSDPSGFMGSINHMVFDGGGGDGCIICQPGGTPSNPLGYLSGGAVATSQTVVLASGLAPAMGAHADNGGGNDLPIGGVSGSTGGGGGGPEGGVGGKLVKAAALLTRSAAVRVKQSQRHPWWREHLTIRNLGGGSTMSRLSSPKVALHWRTSVYHNSRSVT